ncbi:hypothetical protein [Desulfocurvibacter africanus]|uniref:hypothetical protein n=1 Tax=Desulfocurvibacter africanus TaxID=873 RepID=UPI0004180CF6|nr:hypothetical protein [Desulfocurvibacter africanus]
MPARPLVTLALFGLLLLGAWPALALHVEQRDEVSYLRGRYNFAFFERHHDSYQISAAIHFAHGIQHDILALKPIGAHAETDAKADADYLNMLYDPPRTEPTMELFGPYTAQFAWRLLRSIDWTHMHHEQTYDILSDAGIAWNDKKGWTDRSVAYYLEKLDLPMSCAPLDVTMRRAAPLMKPYFTLFRNYYPQSNNFFYAAHWWHPVIYEALMLSGNGEAQHTMLGQTDRTYFEQVLKDRPRRMLLSREAMPRYSRMSPESANIFDNLHMLHGIAYDILSYDKWSPAEQREELYRVIRALSYQPGDEQLTRKFPIPHPDMDPRVYSEWMRGVDGEMNRIMYEMIDEMMPVMMPEGMNMDDSMNRRMREQARMKLAPGLEQGEKPGSLHDAMKAMMPNMNMSPEAMRPGGEPTKMSQAMLQGWQRKYGDMPDVQPISMNTEPTPPVTAAATAQ